jgi:glycosyltransferase involved in cell wall biosynthesis
VTADRGPEPRLSVVVPWRDRAELAEVLAAHGELLATTPAGPVELVVANGGGRREELDGLLAAARLPRSLAVTRVALPEEPFNKSLALNLGVSQARGPYLFLLDADVRLEQDFLPRAVERLGGGGCFVTVERVLEAEGSRPPVGEELAEMAHLFDFVLRGGRRLRLETNRIHYDDGSRSGPGLILLARDDFVAVGGMSSDLEGWGWEDLDLVARLGLGPGLERVELGTVTHLSHGDDVRDLKGPNRAASEGLNFARCLANYSRGHLLGTYHDDVRRLRSRLEVRR